MRNIEKLLADAQRGGDSFFDLVVIDPPWWNRYVRRAKQAKPSAGYQMLDGAAIRDIPLERYVRAGSVVAIWCTNGPSHVAHLKDELLPKWNLKLISTWYWVKVTRRGRTVCEFRDPLQKQPFERLFVACHADSDMKLFESLRETRYLFSVPSSIHSHKPPVIGKFCELASGVVNLLNKRICRSVSAPVSDHTKVSGDICAISVAEFHVNRLRGAENAEPQVVRGCGR